MRHWFLLCVGLYLIGSTNRLRDSQLPRCGAVENAGTGWYYRPWSLLSWHQLLLIWSLIGYDTLLTYRDRPCNLNGAVRGWVGFPETSSGVICGPRIYVDWRVWHYYCRRCSTGINLNARESGSSIRRPPKHFACKAPIVIQGPDTFYWHTHAAQPHRVNIGSCVFSRLLRPESLSRIRDP